MKKCNFEYVSVEKELIFARLRTSDPTSNGFRKYKFLILSVVKNGGIVSSISSIFYFAKRMSAK